MFKVRAILQFRIVVKKPEQQLIAYFSNYKSLFYPQSYNRVFGNGSAFKMKLGNILDSWMKRFNENGVSEPNTSIKLIVGHVLGIRNLEEINCKRNLEINSKMATKIEEMCQKRLQRMPIQYILGEWDFRDLTLKMTPPVFIPRPETELLVDIVIQEIEKREKMGRRVKRILELCCGSGAISLALLKLIPQMEIFAVDYSTKAIDLTKVNAKNLGVSSRLTVIQQEITSGLDLNTDFDLVVSNPPYVPRKQMDLLQPEIKKFEDPRALDGGEDGLDLIKIILRLVDTKLIKSGDKIFLEVDTTHPALVKKILEEKTYPNLYLEQTVKDYGGNDRFLIINKDLLCKS